MRGVLIRVIFNMENKLPRYIGHERKIDNVTSLQQEIENQIRGLTMTAGLISQQLFINDILFEVGSSIQHIRAGTCDQCCCRQGKPNLNTTGSIQSSANLPRTFQQRTALLCLC